MSDGNMTYEDWLRGCVHHDGRHEYVTLPCDEVLKIADFIERLRTDLETEPTISKIIEAYTKGFKDGAEAVKAIKTEQTEREEGGE